MSVETARSETATTWRTHVEWNFSAATGTTFEEKAFAGLDRYIRVRWDLAGDPFTFGASGTSVLVYCSPDHVKKVLNSDVLVKDQRVNFTDEELLEFIEGATDDVSSSLANVFELPLVSWGSDVTRHTALAAGVMAIRRRGGAIDDQQGAQLKALDSKVEKWLELVREEEIELQHVVDSTPDIADGGAYVVTDPPRGWGWP